MNKFIYRLTYFSAPIVIFFALCLLIPATPRASKSLLFANKNKDELLLNIKSPRMIFIGGSNLSFGLNSKMIKNKLNINPINTGVHASIGIRYMLENTIQYVRDGDIVILSLEYVHFYRDYNYVSEELLRTIFDVDLSKIKLLNLQQAVNLIKYVPKYSFSKIKPNEYFNTIESDIYSVNSFNEWGDVDAHWGLGKRIFRPLKSIPGKYNKSIILHILEFQTEVIKRKATLFITFPGLQDVSFLNCIGQIDKVAIEFKKHDFLTLGHPERYKIPNHMMFNTPSHLNKKGVDHRTRQFIDDYNRIKFNQSNKNYL